MGAQSQEHGNGGIEDPEGYQPKVKGRFLSAQGLAVVKRMLAGEAVTQQDSGLSGREWRELMAVLER